MKTDEAEIIKVLTEIRDRGGQLLEAFAEMDAAELASLLPSLRAIADSQEVTLEALAEIRKREDDDHGTT